MLANPDFNGEFDYASYVEIGKNGKQYWGDFFSANFAWRHSVSFFMIGNTPLGPHLSRRSLNKGHNVLSYHSGS